MLTLTPLSRLLLSIFVCVLLYLAPGAIFLTPGNVELMNGHNDGVRLILEGSILENNTAFSAGGAIFSRGSSIEIRKGISVISNNIAKPSTLYYADPGAYGTEVPPGFGGGIFMKAGGKLLVNNSDATLVLRENVGCRRRREKLNVGQAVEI